MGLCAVAQDLQHYRPATPQPMTPGTGMARHHEGDAERGLLDLQAGRRAR